MTTVDIVFPDRYRIFERESATFVTCLIVLKFQTQGEPPYVEGFGKQCSIAKYEDNEWGKVALLVS